MQLARFQLTARVARSVCGSSASRLVNSHFHAGLLYGQFILAGSACSNKLYLKIRSVQSDLAKVRIAAGQALDASGRMVAFKPRRQQSGRKAGIDQ